MAAQQIVVIVVDDNAGFLKGVARLLAHNGIESGRSPPLRRLLDSGMRADGNLPAARHPPRRNFGDRAAAPTSRPRIEVPRDLHDRERHDATRNEATDAGCIAYLRKPFAQNVLLNAISKAVALAGAAKTERAGSSRSFGLAGHRGSAPSLPPWQQPTHGRTSTGNSISDAL